MDHGYQIPDDGKEKPWEEEGCGEPEYGPAPGELDQTCQEIFHIPAQGTVRVLLPLTDDTDYNILKKTFKSGKHDKSPF